MSKTDKTDPSWVKALRKDSPEIREYHDHTRHPCDIEGAEHRDRTFWRRNRSSCGYDVSYYGWHNGFYSRPRRAKEASNLIEGTARAEWRKTKHDLLKLSREDIEDYDVVNYQYRHWAVWDIW